MPRLEIAPQKGKKSVRAEQTVSEVVAEALFRGTGRLFLEVLATFAGHRL